MDELDPELLKEVEDADDEITEDILGVPGVGKKPKDDDDVKELEDESLDALADTEDGLLPEDSFDDVEPEDRW